MGRGKGGRGREENKRDKSWRREREMWERVKREEKGKKICQPGRRADRTTALGIYWTTLQAVNQGECNNDVMILP